MLIPIVLELPDAVRRESVIATAALIATFLVAPGCLTWRAPTTHQYRLGGWSASYRDYAADGEDVCNAEPRWLLEELSSVNELLEEFLSRSPARESAWSDRDLPLLAEARRTLPPVVEVQARTLANAEGCGFSKSGAFPALLARTAKLVDETREQLSHAGSMLTFAKDHTRWEKWSRQLPGEITRAQSRCEKELKPTDIFFAHEDELGVRVWMFCDGVEVTARKGGAHEFQTGPDGKPKGVPGAQPAPYFPAARNHSPLRGPE